MKRDLGDPGVVLLRGTSSTSSLLPKNRTLLYSSLIELKTRDDTTTYALELVSPSRTLERKLISSGLSVPTGLLNRRHCVFAVHVTVRASRRPTFRSRAWTSTPVNLFTRARLITLLTL